MGDFVPPSGIKIIKHQCLLDGNRLHIYYSAYKDGRRGTGRTPQEAMIDLNTVELARQAALEGKL